MTLHSRPAAAVDPELFAKVLRGLIKEKDISIGGLGARIHANKQRGRRSIHRYLAGTHAPTPETLEKIAAALEVDVDELVARSTRRAA